jgi:hypothetical protein
MKTRYLVAVLLVGCSSSADEPATVDSEVVDVESDSSTTSDDTASDDTSTVDSELVDSVAEIDSSVAESGEIDSAPVDSEMAPDTAPLADTSMPDATMADTTMPDTADTAMPDTADTAMPDTADTAMPDTADTAMPDTADTAMPDTAMPDTAPVDVGTDTGVLADCSTPPSASTKWYATLSTARFYATGVTGSVRSCFVEYTPAYELWSDGLAKRRWIYLPPGTKIETGPNPVTGAAPNMDRWVFPIGTRFFKEFARATDGKKLETRVWERTATGYRYGSFRWRADQTDADYTETGGPAALLLDDNATTHEIPTRAECAKCHDGEPGKGLGFSAVQLSKSSDVTLLSIAAKGWLSHVPSAWPNPTLGSPVPGTSVEAAGLGYLHANCGHCHNPLGSVTANDMELRTIFGETNAKTTAVYRTTVGVASKTWSKLGVSLRIDPGTTALGDGVPTKSAVYMRPTFRAGNDQMPPLGTALVDTNGLKGLEAFIKSL